jgi:RNA polymerase sigma-70 factor (ECF subfamily)
MDRDFLADLESFKADILALCRLLLREKRDVEDAVQEVVYQALRSRPRLPDGAPVKGWLRTLTVQTIFNLNRKRREVPAGVLEPRQDEVPLERELELEQSYESVLKDPERVVASLGGRLRRAVGELNEAERSVFLLRSLGELKYQEIARLLNVPLGSVMGNLGRARSKLRKALAEYAHDL